MEIEKLKTAWQRQPVEGRFFSSAGAYPKSRLFLRASTIREHERSDAMARLVFCVMFSLLVGLSAFLLLEPGRTRAGSLLLVTAVLVDGVGAALLLAGGAPAHVDGSVLQFVQKERGRLDRRMRYERYSNRLMIALAAAGALTLFSLPAGGDSRERAYETLSGIAVLTAYLAFLWWRVRSRPREARDELDRHLRDLSAEG